LSFVYIKTTRGFTLTLTNKQSTKLLLTNSQSNVNNNNRTKT